MPNRLYNKQVSPKGYKNGGSVKKDFKLGSKFQGDYKGKSFPGKVKEFVKTGVKQTVGTAKEIGKKFRTKKMGGGMMMKRPMMKEGGKLKMVMKGGKKVPFFAADGKGAKDLGKAAMKKGGLAKLNPGLKAFMKKKMAKKK
jgi:hypothetical protein|tara:strand:+ start:233 stop:655 length:423 start_codon:yes stop_codon:yes gene_type:complete